MPAALIFAAAPLQPTPRLRARVHQIQSPLVIAADDGATTALAFDLTPDVVIGDLDSLAPATRQRLQRSNVPIETFPTDKDFTDGQLAIERAVQANSAELYLLGFLGGPRVDHALANILLLTSLTVPTVLLDEHNECVLLQPSTHHSWTPEAGEVISLIPITHHVTGVTTNGLRWSLADATLERGQTRGVSNEPAATVVSVRIDNGLLLVTRYFPGQNPRV